MAVMQKKLAVFADAGVDVDSLATQLQHEGIESFYKSWNDLMAVIACKSKSFVKTSSSRI